MRKTLLVCLFASVVLAQVQRTTADHNTQIRTRCPIISSPQVMMIPPNGTQEVCTVVDTASPNSFAMSLSIPFTLSLRIAPVAPPSIFFQDNEVPVGVIDGMNAVFTLRLPPSPVGSLELSNGILLKAGGNDYTLTIVGQTATITFVPATVPQVGSNLQASYRSATP